VDDLRCELGCYGVTAIKSPNIDRLAKRGVVFQRAYCQQAVCNPSRVSLMTGLRPDSTRVWDLVTDFRTTIPDAVTIPQHFRKHGYRALSYGKIFHNTFPDHVSWDEPHRWPEKAQLWSDEAKQRLAEFRRKMRDEGKSAAAIRRMRPAAVEIVDISDNQHIDGAIADQAIAAMRRLAKMDQPFFLAAGFIRPHLPFVAPRKYWELYDRDKIPLAADPFLPRGMPAVAFGNRSLGGLYELRDYMDYFDAPSPFERSLTEAQQRELKHGYYASVSLIDAQIGRLLAALDGLRLRENTVIVLWGDHGWKLGEHNGWCKQTNFEIDTRAPLIIAAPGAAANGKDSRALVEFVDIYPTLCDLAGLPVPAALEGTSLKPLLEDASRSVKTAAFSQFPRRHEGAEYMGYAMRTDRYRYVEWQDRRTREVVTTELYDHIRDPLENTNIAGLEENKPVLKRLSRQMWTALPPPPKYLPRKPRRPQAIFRNRKDAPLTLFWITPDGDEQKKGIIQPGQQIPQNTAIGHRFRVLGEDGFSQTFEVTKQQQTFEIKALPRPGKPQKETRTNIDPPVVGAAAAGADDVTLTAHPDSSAWKPLFAADLSDAVSPRTKDKV
ncbi:MAG TPA: sulfatase-like hydrolase/transferase, partial [Pirellulales bacterium]|nr:sulfatase-like hydrolase/transferase [Pirellulales bacterium]